MSSRATLALLLAWTRAKGEQRDRGPLPIGRGASVPVHSEASGAPSWWGMAFTLIVDATLFASLAFGALFLWVSAPGWPPAEVLETEWWKPMLAGLGRFAARRRYAILLAWAAVALARRRGERRLRADPP